MKRDALLVPMCLSDGARTASVTPSFSALPRPLPSSFRLLGEGRMDLFKARYISIVQRDVILSQLCHEQIESVFHSQVMLS